MNVDQRHYDVFLSFTTADKPVADQVKEALEQAGFACWHFLQPQDNRPGEEWPVEISRALAGCQLVVLLYSAAAGQSADVRREIGLANHFHKRVLTVKLDDSLFPPGVDYYLQCTQFLPASGTPFSGWRTGLLHDVSRYVDKPVLFPIDSVRNRAVKVNVMQRIVDLLYGATPVECVGTGLKLSGLTVALSAAPSRVESLLISVRQYLAECVCLTRRAAPAVFTVESKEDLFLLVGTAPNGDGPAIGLARTRLRQITEGVCHLCVEHLQVLKCDGAARLPRLDNERVIVDFLRRLGEPGAMRPVDAAGVAGATRPNTECPTGLDPELSADLRGLAALDKRVRLLLPECPRVDAAAAYLRQLSGS